jgi:L-lactate dehydrogenase complex protein LldG
VDRDSFLSRVGRASLTSQLPDSPAVSADLPEFPPADLLALFRSRAHAVNAVIHGPVTRHGVPRAVTGIVTGHNATSFMAWDELPAPGVTSALQAAGVARVDHVVPPGSRTEHNLGYIDVDVGITGADVALAESGSIVLVHGAGRPRMASLVPDVHIALLDVERLDRTLAHWAQKNPTLVAKTTNLVFVTGPSRTGDIEQELNLGVHGPRHVHIVMIK